MSNPSAQIVQKLWSYCDVLLERIRAGHEQVGAGKVAGRKRARARGAAITSEDAGE